MSTIQFIDNNPQVILQELISEYEKRVGYKTNPADPERLLIVSMAYRETLLRGAMEKAMKQNFVQTAEDEALDYWGSLFGIVRLKDEIDNEYRNRILEINQNNQRGTKAVYLQIVKSLPEVADVDIISRWEDPLISPGAIVIIPIQKKEANGKIFGDVTESRVQDVILNTLKNENVGCVGDLFFIQNPQKVLVNGNIQISYLLLPSVTLNQLKEQVLEEVTKYINELSLSLISVFDEITLTNRILKNQMLKSVEINISVPIPTGRSFYSIGNIQITT